MEVYCAHRRCAPYHERANGSSMEERRQSARQACSLNVRYRLDKEGALTMDTVGMNISDRGMFMRPSGGLLEGQRIRMRFTLPDKAEIRNARAMVIRQEPQDCVAVMFVSVRPNVQECFE
jgi:PilZ domain